MPNRVKAQSPPIEGIDDYVARLRTHYFVRKHLDVRNERRTRAGLRDLGVLKDLKTSDQVTLTRFVLAVRLVLAVEPDAERTRAYMRLSPANIRKLMRKTTALKRAFSALRDHWMSFRGTDKEPARNPYLACDLHDLGFTAHLDDIGDAIDALPVLTESLISPDPSDQVPLDKSSRSVTLTDFFSKRLGCSKKESEIRIAKIENRYWFSQVKFREKGDGVDSRGSDAVRKRRERARQPEPRRDSPQKISSK